MPMALETASDYGVQIEFDVEESDAVQPAQVPYRGLPLRSENRVGPYRIASCAL